MSYQSDIYEAILGSASLTELIGDRFSWDSCDGETATPYLVAQTVSSIGETTHDGEREWTFPLIQFSCWAKTKAEAIAVMSAFKIEFEGVEIPGESCVSLAFSGEQSTRDQETKLYGEMIDYRVSAITN